MRDYLFVNPNLIFEDDTWAVPIVEEKCLPESSLDKSWGRADMMLCVVNRDRSLTKKEGSLCLADVDVWIVELKKEEASYENGFRQLFDYLVVMKNSEEARKELKRVLEEKLEEYLDVKSIDPLGDTNELGICGALVAPSFDLVSRTTKLPTKDVEIYREDYMSLEDNLRSQDRLAGGFTLCDAIHSCEMFKTINLMKVIRFKRSDEIIVYSENALGKKAEVQSKLKRVDPVDLFAKGIIAKDDDFSFRDQTGVVHSEVVCRVLCKRGPSHSFVLQVRSIPSGKVPYPEPYGDWPYKYRYSLKSIPIASTTKTISHALHKLFEVFPDEGLPKYYWQYGEHNFLRQHDNRALSELKEEYLEKYGR